VEQPRGQGDPESVGLQILGLVSLLCLGVKWAGACERLYSLTFTRSVTR